MANGLLFLVGDRRLTIDIVTSFLSGTSRWSLDRAIREGGVLPIKGKDCLVTMSVRPNVGIIVEVTEMKSHFVALHGLVELWKKTLRAAKGEHISVKLDSQHTMSLRAAIAVVGVRFLEETTGGGTGLANGLIDMIEEQLFK